MAWEPRAKEWHNEIMEWHGSLSINVPFEYVKKELIRTNRYENMPTLGAFWVVWNEGKFLEQSLKSLESVLSEITIVIDKKTTDNTAEIAENFKEQTNIPVAILYPKKMPLGNLCNLGIETMKSEWWIQVHGNEIWPEEQAQNLKMLCASNPCNFVGYRICQLDLLTPLDAPEVYIQKNIGHAARLYKNFHGIKSSEDDYPHEAPCFPDGTPVCHYIPRISTLWFYHLQYLQDKSIWKEKAEWYCKNAYSNDKEKMQHSIKAEIDLLEHIKSNVGIEQSGKLLSTETDERKHLEKWV